MFWPAFLVLFVICCLLLCNRLLDEIAEGIYTGMDKAAKRSQMILEAVALGTVKLTVYARDNSPEIDPARRYPAVLVIPGGGYGMCSDREAEPVALPFLAVGCTPAVLRYSIAPARHPTQFHEVAAAMAYLREHTDDYHIDPARVFVCGFSAGGHLAAMLGCLWLETPEGDLARPTGMILCYPVISGGAYAHRGSFENMTIPFSPP